MDAHFADYDEYRGYLNKLIKQKSKRLLFLKAPSQFGKTHLLEYYQGSLEEKEGIESTLIDLNECPVETVLSLIINSLGKEKFPKCKACLTQQIEQINLYLQGIKQIGAKQDLTIEINQQSISDYRYQTYTEALMDDIQAFQSPLVLLFDTYDGASKEVKNWLSNLLPNFYNIKHLYIVIAGQQIPAENSSLKRFLYMTKEIEGVKAPGDWLEFLKKINSRHLKNPGHIYFVEEVCKALEGIPGNIINILDRDMDRAA